MSRKKIVLGTIAATCALVAAAFFIIFLMDVDRMKHNEPVIFSTWGYKYAPPANIEENTVEDAIENCILNENKDNFYNKGNEKWFVSQRVYFTEKYKNGDVTVCTWIFAESYYKENGEIKSVSGFSAPYKFSLLKTDSGYTVNNYQTPRDGSDYKKDMLRIFRLDIYLAMSNVQVDGTAAMLNEQNKAQAEEYFKDK